MAALHFFEKGGGARVKLQACGKAGEVCGGGGTSHVGQDAWGFSFGRRRVQVEAELHFFLRGCWVRGKLRAWGQAGEVCGGRSLVS